MVGDFFQQIFKFLDFWVECCAGWPDKIALFRLRKVTSTCKKKQTIKKARLFWTCP